MKKVFLSLFLCLTSLGHAATSDASDESAPSRSLKGTIWMSAESLDLSGDDHLAKFTRNMGTDIVIYFWHSYGDRHSAKVDRLNAGPNTDFNTGASLIPSGNNSYIYQEDYPRPLTDFASQKGHGIFRIIDSDTAELTDVRRLHDGSAHTFVIKLNRLDTRFSNPVAQDRPPGQ